jgi:hypothetical protein
MIVRGAPVSSDFVKANTATPSKARPGSAGLPLKETYVIEASLIRKLGGAEKGSASRRERLPSRPAAPSRNRASDWVCRVIWPPLCRGRIGLSFLGQSA